MTTTWGSGAVALPPTLLGPARELAAMAVTALLRNVPDDDDEVGGSAPMGAGRPGPVLLVHGYGGAKTQWLLVRRTLRDAGFTCVRTFEYEATGTDIPTLARRLCAAVRALLAETGAERVHLVGHSLGGIVIRHAVSCCGLDPVVGAAVTLASPHGGSPTAWAGTGKVAAQLRPGSTLLRELEAAARPGRAAWVAFSAGLDAVVPAARARLRPAALAAENVHVPGEGHLSILLSLGVARAVAQRLLAVEAAERPEAGAALAA